MLLSACDSRCLRLLFHLGNSNIQGTFSTQITQGRSQGFRELMRTHHSLSMVLVVCLSDSARQSPVTAKLHTDIQGSSRFRTNEQLSSVARGGTVCASSQHARRKFRNVSALLMSIRYVSMEARGRGQMERGGVGQGRIDGKGDLPDHPTGR